MLHYSHDSIYALSQSSGNLLVASIGSYPMPAGKLRIWYCQRSLKGKSCIADLFPTSLHELPTVQLPTLA